MSGALISKSEFGRRLDVNEKQVRRWIEQGKLPDRPDGKLPASLVNDGLRKPNRRKPGRSDDSDTIKLGETPEEAAGRIVLEEGHAPHSLPEAVRIKENYLAKLKELEYDLKSGALVRVADVQAIVAGEYSIVRNRLMSISAEIAPKLAILRTAPEVQSALEAEHAAALESLALDAGAEPDAIGRTVRERTGRAH